MSGQTTGSEALRAAGAAIGRPGPTWRGDGVARPTGDRPGHTPGLPRVLRPCSIQRRMAGLLIDQALFWAIVLAIASVVLAVAGVEEEPPPGTREATIFEAIGLLALIGPMLYFWGWNAIGSTPGKQLLGVRIVNAQGAPPGFRRGLARTVASLLVPLSFGLAYAWAAWDSDAARPLADGFGQAWHDKLSGTYVVRA